MIVHADRSKEKSRKRPSSCLIEFVIALLVVQQIQTFCTSAYTYVSASHSGKGEPPILWWFETGWFCINVETIHKIGEIPCHVVHRSSRRTYVEVDSIEQGCDPAGQGG